MPSEFIREAEEQESTTHNEKNQSVATELTHVKEYTKALKQFLRAEAFQRNIFSKPKLNL